MAWLAIDKVQNFDLLNPPTPVVTAPPPQKYKFNFEEHKSVLDVWKKVMQELQSTFAVKQKTGAYHTNHIRNLDVVGTVHEQLEELAAQNQLEHMGKEVFVKYKAVFKPISHVNDLPTDVWCHINIKDASKRITMRTYSSPCKYCEAWRTLL